MNLEKVAPDCSFKLANYGQAIRVLTVCEFEVESPKFLKRRTSQILESSAKSVYFFITVGNLSLVRLAGFRIILKGFIF
jgi:hypothetical protein